MQASPPVPAAMPPPPPSHPPPFINSGQTFYMSQVQPGVGPAAHYAPAGTTATMSTSTSASVPINSQQPQPTYSQAFLAHTSAFLPAAQPPAQVPALYPVNNSLHPANRSQNPFLGHPSYYQQPGFFLPSSTQLAPPGVATQPSSTAPTSLQLPLLRGPAQSASVTPVLSPTSKPKVTRWSAAQHTALIAAVKQHSPSWVAIAGAVNQAGGPVRSAEGCKQRWLRAKHATSSRKASSVASTDASSSSSSAPLTPFGAGTLTTSTFAPAGALMDGGAWSWQTSASSQPPNPFHFQEQQLHQFYHPPQQHTFQQAIMPSAVSPAAPKLESRCHAARSSSVAAAQTTPPQPEASTSTIAQRNEEPSKDVLMPIAAQTSITEQAPGALDGCLRQHHPEPQQSQQARQHETAGQQQQQQTFVSLGDKPYANLQASNTAPNVWPPSSDAASSFSSVAAGHHLRSSQPHHQQPTPLATASTSRGSASKRKSGPQWSPSQDALLLALVKQLGPMFDKVAVELNKAGGPSRSTDGARARFYKLQAEQRRSGPLKTLAHAAMASVFAPAPASCAQAASPFPSGYGPAPDLEATSSSSGSTCATIAQTLTNSPATPSSALALEQQQHHQQPHQVASPHVRQPGYPWSGEEMEKQTHRPLETSNPSSSALPPRDGDRWTSQEDETLKALYQTMKGSPAALNEAYCNSFPGTTRTAAAVQVRSSIVMRRYRGENSKVGEAEATTSSDINSKSSAEATSSAQDPGPSPPTIHRQPPSDTAAEASVASTSGPSASQTAPRAKRQARQPQRDPLIVSSASP